MNSLFHTWRRLALLCVIATVAFSLGCGKSGPQTIPVTGKVTFGGGSPPAAGSVTFAPLEEAQDRLVRPGQANFSTDGNFHATSFKDGDGLLPGRYGVTVFCQKPRSSDIDDPQSFSYVPRGFRPPDILVDASAGELQLNIDVPAKQPLAK